MISLLEHSTCRVCVSTLGTGRSGKGRTPQLDPAPDIKRKMLAPKPHGLRLRATDIYVVDLLAGERNADENPCTQRVLSAWRASRTWDCSAGCASHHLLSSMTGITIGFVI